MPSSFAERSPVTGPSVVCPTAVTSTNPKPRPATVAASRWPRIVSVSDSRDSTPTSMSTKRNSIMIAPV